MKILVTGGAGFIASHIVDKLITDKHSVVVVDNLSSGFRVNINKKAKFYKFDICDKKIEKIFQKEKPEIVFHYAAHIEARESAKDPISDAKINIIGGLNVLENCRKNNVKKIIFASSGGEIYGNAKIIPTEENYIPVPLSPYGIAKFALEKYLHAYFTIYGIEYVALRYGNVYGPRQNPKGESGVIAIFIDKILKGNKVIIHGQGTQTKDYIFIEDVVDASVKSFKSDFSGVLNIAAEKETSVLDIFEKTQKIIGKTAEKSHTEFPTIGFPRGCLSIKKAKEILGWEPKYSLEDGLKKTINWFKAK